MIRTVFFGSSEYSIIILQSLLYSNNFEIIAVVSKEDKPIGRQQIITPNPMAKFAKENNLSLLQPANFTPDFIDKFKKLDPDLGIIVAYGPPYFTKEMIDIPRFKIVNIHPSPLPKYRGATPGPWQIINGETESAVSFFQIDALPDHGPIIAQIPFKIEPNETAQTFYNKAFNLAASNLDSILSKYINNPNELIIQDHSQKTYFPKFTKESAQIDWSWSIQKIERFIRALSLWPIAWTYVENQSHQKLKMKIYSSILDKENLVPKDVQVEGKKITSWRDISQYYIILK